LCPDVSDLPGQRFSRPEVIKSAAGKSAKESGDDSQTWGRTLRFSEKPRETCVVAIPALQHPGRYSPGLRLDLGTRRSEPHRSPLAQLGSPLN